MFCPDTTYADRFEAIHNKIKEVFDSVSEQATDETIFENYTKDLESTRAELTDLIFTEEDHVNAERLHNMIAKLYIAIQGRVYFAGKLQKVSEPEDQYAVGFLAMIAWLITTKNFVEVMEDYLEIKPE